MVSALDAANFTKSVFLDPGSTILNALDPAGKVLGGISAIENFLARPDMPTQTRVRTSHGAYLYAIIGGKPRVLGAIQSISEQQQAQQVDRFEINVASDGTPNHIETNNLTSRVVSCKILELNDALIERTLGRDARGLQGLISLLPTIHLVSTDLTPGGAVKYHQHFIDCKVENFGRTRSIEDDRMVHCDVSFRWTRLLNAK